MSGRETESGNESNSGFYSPDRRRLLKLLGVGGVTGLAGCGLGGDGDGTPTGTPTDSTGGTPGSTPTATPTNVDQIQEGGTLRVAVAENISSFDPPYSNDTTSSLAQNFFYEALTTSDPQGNIYPWLAQSYELVETNDVGPADYADYMVSIPYAEDDEGNVFVDTEDQIVLQHPDNNPEEDDEARVLTVNETGDAVADGTFGMQFQYNLHEGVTFTNGEEMTAENVVRSYERYENSQMSAQTFDIFLHAEAVDDYTVNLYAQRPSAEAVRNLPVLVFPTDHIDLPGGDLDPRQGTTPVGTGPWVFEDFEDAEYYVVSKNEDYWLDDVGLDAFDWWDGPSDFPTSPVIDEIDMDLIPDNSTRAAALQNDEVDLSYGLTSDARTNFDESEDYTVASTETGGYLFLQYPVQVEPWDDQNVRRAVNHLIPRTQIVDNIEQGWAREAWTPLPQLAYASGTADPEALEEDLKPMNEYDPARAEELINEAGVETPIEVQLETNADNDDRVRKVELIAESMNQSGLFDVSVETFEWLAFLGRILSTDYWDRGNLFVVGLSGTFDPGSFCEATHHSRNFGQCCNTQRIEWSELDQMMDDAKYGTDVLNDQDLRGQRYDEVWHQVVERSGNSYIDIGLTTATHNNTVRGFNAYPFSEGLLSYGLFSPVTQQITWLESDG